MFAVIGALIVFLTFVVNDILRERLKDMASSIASAQNFLVIRRDLWSLQKQIRQIGLSTSDVMSMVSLVQELLLDPTPRPPLQLPQVITPADDPTLKQRVLDSDTWGVDAKGDLDGVTQLLRGMPEDQSSVTEQKSLEVEWADLSRIRSDLETKLAQLDARTNPKNREKAARGELRAQWLKYQSQEITWSRKVEIFEYRNIRRAENIKDQAEHHYKIYTRASYALYTLGWSLALIGKLWGEPRGEGMGE